MSLGLFHVRHFAIHYSASVDPCKIQGKAFTMRLALFCITALEKKATKRISVTWASDVIVSTNTHLPCVMMMMCAATKPKCSTVTKKDTDTGYIIFPGRHLGLSFVRALLFPDDTTPSSKIITLRFGQQRACSN